MSNSEENKNETPGQNKEVTIIVNGREKLWSEKKISYIQVVELAFSPVDPNATYTVTYKKGVEPKHEGSLVKGESVPIKSGMIFNVTATNKS